LHEQDKKKLTMHQVYKPGVSNTRPAGRMWPARTFCAARDAFWKFSNN